MEAPRGIHPEKMAEFIQGVPGDAVVTTDLASCIQPQVQCVQAWGEVSRQIPSGVRGKVVGSGAALIFGVGFGGLLDSKVCQQAAVAQVEGSFRVFRGVNIRGKFPASEVVRTALRLMEAE